MWLKTTRYELLCLYRLSSTQRHYFHYSSRTYLSIAISKGSKHFVFKINNIITDFCKFDYIHMFANFSNLYTFLYSLLGC